MKSLHIRNLDESVLQGLKRRATRHRRSLQKEVEVLLEDAARMSPEEPNRAEPTRLELHTVATGNTHSNWSRDDIYNDDGR